MTKTGKMLQKTTEALRALRKTVPKLIEYNDPFWELEAFRMLWLIRRLTALLDKYGYAKVAKGDVPAEDREVVSQALNLWGVVTASLFAEAEGLSSFGVVTERVMTMKRGETQRALKSVEAMARGQMGVLRQKMMVPLADVMSRSLARAVKKKGLLFTTQLLSYTEMEMEEMLPSAVWTSTKGWAKESGVAFSEKTTDEVFAEWLEELELE